MNQKQSQENETEAKQAKEKAAVPAKPLTPPQDQHRDRKSGVDFGEMERMRAEDPLYIEKTRPEDPSGRAGQLTRDNVNPNIPSGNPGDPPGPIVDPNSLGMPQGGIAPTSPMQPERSPDQPPRANPPQLEKSPDQHLPGQDQPPQSKDKGK